MFDPSNPTVIPMQTPDAVTTSHGFLNGERPLDDGAIAEIELVFDAPAAG